MFETYYECKSIDCKLRGKLVFYGRETPLEPSCNECLIAYDPPTKPIDIDYMFDPLNAVSLDKPKE